jgi:hypothetical protein
VTATRPARPAPTPRGGVPVRRRFLPPQHGAWAMLAVPYLAGLVAAGYRWPDAPLLAAWISGYLLSYYALQAVKTLRPRRYRDQLLLYAAVALPLTALVVAARPEVLRYAPAYAVLLAVNVWYAARRRERALLNDLVSVLQSCLIVPVVGTVAGAGPARVAVAFALCLAYFAGTTLYVKTMIRERGNPAYRRWSVGYHLAALAFVAALATAGHGWSVTGWGPYGFALFAWLALRSALLPRLGLPPKRVGLLEIANCVLLLGCVALTVR